MSRCLVVFLVLIHTLYCKSGTIVTPNLNQQNPVGTDNCKDCSSVASLKNKGYFSGEYHHFCSGSILSKDWILTAGHCFSQKSSASKEDIVVDVGTTSLTGEGGSRYHITDFIIHPNQSESIEIYKNDLCLVKLEKPIMFTGKIKPVKLSTINDQEELPVVAGGWGRVSQYGSLHKQLRLLNLNTLKYDKCQEIHKKRNNIVDPVTHICGFDKHNKKTLCFGDSGGPMFDSTGKQVAVFSSLEDCSGDYPVLFMKIEKFLDWINEVTKLNLTLN